MRLAIASDIHLDFGSYNIKNDQNADLLILAGDILPTNTFLETVSKEFPKTIMIMGNHEFYNDYYDSAESRIREMAYQYSNIHFLEKECIIIDDITFIGTTLWTDMNKRDPLTLIHMKRMMQDFNCIRVKGGKLFTANDSTEEHNKSLDYIKHCVAEKHDQKFVVITHHGPSFQSCHPKYKEHRMMNGAFYSDLDDFIIDSPQIKLWIHGHTHEPFDYMINETRIVCNPRGYVGYERQALDYVPKIVEL